MSQPLNSYNAFQYLWFYWRLIGIHPSESHRILYWCYSLIMHSLFAIFLPLTMVMQLFFVSNFMRIINNLTITLTATTSTVKEMIIFYYSRSHLQQVRLPLHYLDQRIVEGGNLEEHNFIENALLLCRRIFFTYNVAYWSALTSYALLGLMRHSLMFDSWLPFDWNATSLAYIVGFSFHVIGTTVQLMQNLTNDCYPATYLMILVAHFRVLHLRISNVGRNSNLSIEQNYEQLIQCIRDHKECMNYFYCIQPVISGTIFIQMFSTGFVLCITALGFLISNRSMLQLLTSGIYLSCIIIEILPCCWFANALLAETDNLTTALYNCAWYEQDQRFRRSLIIFMQRSQKSNKLMAGNLTPITLQTFLGIIRFAFSMFTILSQINT